MSESKLKDPEDSGSCLSMKSDQSMEHQRKFKDGGNSAEFSLIENRKSDSEHSCVSLMSAASMDTPVTFNDGAHSSDWSKQKASKTSHLELIFKELEYKIISLVKKELRRFKKLLNPEYSGFCEREAEDKEGQNCARQGALTITLHILKNMNQADLANTLLMKLVPACYQKIKSNLRKKFQTVNEGISKQDSSALLSEIYTELYLTEGESGEINREHEVRQIETASRRLVTQEANINCNDIFKPLSGQDRSIRTVLTKGVAGIGKTVSVQKFIVDWAEGRANQDVHCIFPLPFRELNLVKERKLSLMDLLHCFFPETRGITLSPNDIYKVMLIFDGLDECRLPLDFQKNENLSDVTEVASVDTLLTNLIKGNLLPSALLWITSRPAACGQIPSEFVDQVTEVRGFKDLQKEEYFRRRITDQSLANRIIAHMKSSRSLYIMCHIPVFCWIAATVLKKMLMSLAASGEIPKTLTQMFIHFLTFQTKRRSLKYHRKDECTPHQIRESVLVLGKLAFQQLEKGNLIFYEDDLRECGVDVREVSVYSGVCTQIFREEFGLHLGKVFSFVHLSVQEFLAALYVFVSFINRDQTEMQVIEQNGLFNEATKSEFLKSAVDMALQSKTGHLDLFLRFLLGLSLESNQTLLRSLLPQTESSPHKEEMVKYIKKKIKMNLSPEKSINLFHCLNELNDDSLVQEVQTYLNRRGGSCLHGVSLSPSQWSALVFVLVNSEDGLEDFKLSKYDSSGECLQHLLPAVQISRNANLSSCNLTKKNCAALASALISNSSNLKELNLSNNNLQDSGVKLLSAGLENPQCKLETLRLSNCNLTEQSCATLASALISDSSNLKELNLSNNKLQDSGVALLSGGLDNPHCKLETLSLNSCSLTEGSCAILASVLKSNYSSLRELDLTYNGLNSGMELLSVGLNNQHCKLKTLCLYKCGLEEDDCVDLIAALKSNPSHLKELNLGMNKPGGSGVEHLSALLEDPNCKLEKLKLFNCDIGEEGCATLALALKSNPLHLIELDLRWNKPTDSVVRQLSALKENPCCRLQKLLLCQVQSGIL
ncbi:NACHT, LRR and PYD domains-containing protein 3-like isoform X1 [Salminus brasiliensis]|uniref:NACHT, LRR and PYD domains-containing protein 3-like isoform X1 n=1 Tax=Salminus brasiliensis TaxID=930266 RepID=UPI003B8376CC